MKRLFIIMMCCLGLAFTSCKPKPVPANQAFLGSYLGTITLTGNASAPELANFGLPTEFPLENMDFILNAVITSGESDDKVIVNFSIQEETYQQTCTVNARKLYFGTISYRYTFENNDFTVNLDLEGTLSEDGNSITLAGPYIGGGSVSLPGFPISINLDVTGNVDGVINRIQN